jgi:hypothetical protein
MCPKKPGYNLEQHEKLGLELQTMRDRLVKIEVELSHAYPFKTAGLAKNAWKAIDTLRCSLDDKVCAENRFLKDAGKVYYRANRPDYTPVD